MKGCVGFKREGGETELRKDKGKGGLRKGYECDVTTLDIGKCLGG